MKFGFILFFLATSATSVWAECPYMPDRKCVEFKFIEAIEKGTGKTAQMCLGKVILSADQSESQVFFRSCPKPETVLQGDLNQRSDMTIEDMAACRYQYKKNDSCKK